MSRPKYIVVEGHTLKVSRIVAVISHGAQHNSHLPRGENQCKIGLENTKTT